MTTDDIKSYYTHGVFPTNPSKEVIEIGISDELLTFWMAHSDATPLHLMYKEMASSLTSTEIRFISAELSACNAIYLDFISDFLLLTHFVDDDEVYKKMRAEGRYVTCEYYTYDISKLKAYIATLLSVITTLKVLYIGNKKLNGSVRYHDFTEIIYNKLYFHIANRITTSTTTQLDTLEAAILKVAQEIHDLPSNVIYKYNVVCNGVHVDNHRDLRGTTMFTKYANINSYIREYKSSRYKLYTGDTTI